MNQYDWMNEGTKAVLKRNYRGLKKGQHVTLTLVTGINSPQDIVEVTTSDGLEEYVPVEHLERA